jgi:geranylgeranyl diphosphate synthase type I
MSDTLRQALHDEVERCRRLTDAVLLDPTYRDRFGPEHLRRAVYAYIERPAKRLRPALLLLCCRAVGGNERQAIPAAAAVELFHTWTLVHDDVIDNDSRRRGQPTVHVAAAQWARDEFGLAPDLAVAYGRTVAILAGDVQQAWCNALLLECADRGVPAGVVLGLLARLQTVLNHRLMAGEMLDVQLSVRPIDDIREDEVLHMLGLKTGALLAYAAAAGAAIGCGRLPGADPVIDALGRFAELGGLAFQLQDDILGVVGVEAQLGKPVGSDLREGKATVLVLHALQQGSPASRATIRQVLGNATASAAAVGAACRCLQEAGSVDYARGLAEGFLARALEVLRGALPPAAPRDLLEAWARSLVERSS